MKNKKKTIKQLKKIDPSIKTANELELAPPFAESNFVAELSKAANKDVKWIIEIEEYCNAQNITPKDLIAAHKNFKAPKKQNLSSAITSSGASLTYLEKRRNQKSFGQNKE